MGVPLYSSCVLFGSLVLFFSIYYFYRSKKKKVLYRAMAQSMCEIMWIRQLLMEVSIETSVPAKLWCDN